MQTPTPEPIPAQIDPTPFIQVAAPRGHRKRFAKHCRVFFGATIDTATAKQIDRWAGKTLSRGLITDQVVALAKRRKFKPNRKKKSP